MTPEEFRAAGHRLVDLLADDLRDLPQGPVHREMNDDQKSRLTGAPLPAKGATGDELVDAIARDILPFAMGNGHPRFFAWVNSAPHPAGALAELAAAVMGPSCAGGDHAGVHLEHGVLRWLAELVGYPMGAGLLTSGGASASLTALAAARHAASVEDGGNDREDGITSRLVLYVTTGGHSCLRKAAELLGIGAAGVRTLDAPAIPAAIAEDRAAGRRPFAVAASAGTTNTGAIDPLDDLADVCAAEGLWLHVDGAYGAFGRLDEEIASAYAGLERADSLTLDPHKWPGVPVGCGALLVRDAGILRDTFSLVPDYLRTAGDDVWFAELGFEQTRPFRALKAWATLSALGREGLTAQVRRHRALARTLAGRVGEAPDLELLGEPILSVVCFRHTPPGMAPEAVERLNERLAAAVQAEGHAFLAGTVVDGRAALRACVLHRDTVPGDLDALLDAVRAAAR